MISPRWSRIGLLRVSCPSTDVQTQASGPSRLAAAMRPSTALARLLNGQPERRLLFAAKGRWKTTGCRIKVARSCRTTSPPRSISTKSPPGRNPPAGVKDPGTRRVPRPAPNSQTQGDPVFGHLEHRLLVSRDGQVPDPPAAGRDCRPSLAAW